ncbi:MAG: hypothetical protein D6814_04800 [Calditrichaeota bacterium]|nr:MAG: hypothetical protein D6814_04800 [Calditrichota bacterium]
MSLALLFMHDHGFSKTMQFRILDNYKVKLFSFVAASLFWFMVVTENDYQYDIYVQIKPVNLPKDRVILNDLPRKALVRFRGRGKSLLTLRFSNEAALELDLTNVTRNKVVVVKDNMIHISRRSQDINSWHVLSPDKVLVRVGRLAKKVVPIVPQIEVEPVIGYTQVGKVKLEPDSLEISGPAKFVRNIRQIYTEKKSFKKVKYRFSGHIKLQPLPDSLRLHLAIHDIKYEVDIQKLLEIQIEEIPVQVINVPRHWKVTPIPSTVTLTVRGGERLLMQLSRDDFKAYIDFAQARKAGSNGHIPMIEAPPEVTISSVRPQRFKLASERRTSR